MPKYRKLHVKTTESWDVNDMPDDFTRLFWVLLPLALDREGRGMDNPAWLKSKVFPLRVDVTPERIEAAMAWFAKRGMIRRYSIKSRGYFAVPTFARYQGDTSKEAESEYPAPPEPPAANSGPSPELVQTKSASDADADANAATEANANTNNGADAPSPPPPAPPLPVKAQDNEPEEPPEPARSKRAPALTVGQSGVLDLFGAKRYKTRAAADAVLALEANYGTTLLLEAATWAAKKQMSLGDAITSMETALPAWGTRKKPNNGDGRRAPPGAAPEPKGYAAIRKLAEEEGWTDT